jgi:ATP-dependent exoDNAse (exonuclease V) beta subunit
LVDYKTEGRDAASVKRLTNHYRAQVQLYADTWRELVHEPIQELGLYFTRTNQYVRL